MATTQASASSGKPSFAKIAATGLKPPHVPQTQSNNSPNLRKQSITSAPRDGPTHVTPSAGHSSARPTSQTRKFVQTGVQHPQDVAGRTANGPQVHVQNVDGMAPKAQNINTASGLLAPLVADDANTQLSTSSGSGKPLSLDGKSVASGTTFALDEKESLRPDDSASVQAVEDEDSFLPPLAALSAPSLGLEDGARAFRDQLREISAMEPTRHSMSSQVFGAPTHATKGVLYVPPPGSGVGLVPHAASSSNETSEGLGCPPDPKLLEALESPRDRLMVMKLQTDIVDFINDPKEASLILPQCNAYHRMLAHKAADYYLLGHVLDDSASGVRLFKTTSTCLRLPLIDMTTPSTAASTPPPNAPQMKILRRGMDANPAIVNGSNLPSKSTSENGEDDDKKSKVPMSREEREARYETVRLRIMGAAKPSDLPDEPKSKDNSRSSSAAGKKSKKKQRSDSDDGFEARSAFSAYYTPPYTSHGYAAHSFGHPASSNGAVTGQAGFTDQGASSEYQPYAAHNSGGTQWPGQGYQGNNMQQPSYDLAGDFQRSMSLQGIPPPQPSIVTAGFNSNYQQQYLGVQQSWPQSGYPMAPHMAQANSDFYGNYQPGMAASQIPGPHQSYQYGQLPSQAFPGRPASNLEHPLPGSYKGKHFNPQSQAFVPGQPSTAPAGRFSPQGLTPPTNGVNSSYGMPSPLQRQSSTQGHTAPFVSPQHQHAVPNAQPGQGQHMMHPLPQPVFPRQASPHLPLPLKPGSTPQKSTAQQSVASLAYSQQGQSSISKWGAPASLPAKPPPSAEPFDPARFSQVQRQPAYNAAAAARMPSFGSMPPMAPGLGVASTSAAQHP